MPDRPRFDPRQMVRGFGGRGLDPATVETIRDAAREAGSRVSTIARDVSARRRAKDAIPDPHVLWVMTRRGRSGTWWTHPLLAIREETTPEAAAEEAEEDVTFVVNASTTGQVSVPRWALNMRSNARGYVKVADQFHTATFEEVLGADRENLFDDMSSMWRALRLFAARSEDPIPVFRIRLGEPIDETSLPVQRPRPESGHA